MAKQKNNAERVKWAAGTMLYPLPAVLVSCGNAQTGFNLITIAWTGTICSTPAQCYISVRPERYSYSLLEKTGVFAINLTTEKLLFATDWCGVKSGRDFDKFKECNLTPLSAHKISAPIIAESPLAIECKITRQIPLGTHTMFIADVVGLNADGKLIDPKSEKFALDQARPIVYLHGQYYALGKPLGKFGFSVQKKIKKRSRQERKK